jgi:molybdopterin synthase sulfur carrier subunit
VLRTKFGVHGPVSVSGATVREVIDILEQSLPGLAFALCYETGELRPYVNIFVERDNIRYLQGLETPLVEGASIRVLQSVAGG